MKLTFKSVIAALFVSAMSASCVMPGMSQSKGGGLGSGNVNGSATTTTGQTTGTTTQNNGSAGSVLGGVLGAMTNGSALGNIISSVIGLDKPSENTIVGNWHYTQPGVAFTSENLLAKAGGEMVAAQIKDKLATYYNTVGIKATNTALAFNADKSFSGKLLGTPVSGTWAYDAKKCQMTMKTALFTLNPYVKGTTTGLSLLFESKKLLTVLQTVASMSGNATLQGIGSISTNYDGVRIGFDMSK